MLRVCFDSSSGRGNLTAVTSLVSSGSTITTATNSYNILGDLISTKDGNGNTTSYDYIDAWSSGKANDVGGSTFAYQTSVSDPLGHLGARAYVATNEFLDQVQEANDLANSRAGTQYTYDALQRPTSTTYADGGNTTITYLTAQSGSPASMSVSTVRDGNLSDNIVSTTVLDGLARQSSTTEANGTVTTTSYDQMGRVSCVTNPHASAQESTDGQTYDALSRSLQVTEPDSSTQMSSLHREHSRRL